MGTDTPEPEDRPADFLESVIEAADTPPVRLLAGQAREGVDREIEAAPISEKADVAAFDKEVQEAIKDILG